MPYNILITRPIPEAGLEILAGECDPIEIGPAERPFTRAELHQAVRGRNGVISTLADRIDESFFEAAGSGLKVVAQFAVGFDNIDLRAAADRGVIITNTPDVLTNATADLTWALILSIARRVLEGDRLARSGEWTGWAPLQLLGRDVAGKTLGILGAGRIGTAVGKRAAGFDMAILYVDDRPNAPLEMLGARRTDLDHCLAESDFVTVHAPLTAATRGLIGADRLALMRPTAYLINAARGPIVDEAALVEALRGGRIAGAGLDVYEFEPRLAAGLADLDNVVCLPHLGSATVETRDAMARIAANNLIAALAREEPPNRVRL